MVFEQQSSGLGYFDLQVNGYVGVDFNKDDLSADELLAACERLRRDGVDAILATIITDNIAAMSKRLANLAAARAGSALATEMVIGVHIEGPFLSPETGYRGAHPLDAILPANVDTMKRLLDAADGLVRLVTLAPEHDAGFAVTRMLSGQGIAVSAGHCDPSIAQLAGAIDAGISLFTHLGNGCPMTMHRHDNIIQRALSLSDRLWICVIADGVHVPFPALRNMLRAAGLERCIVVTDAIAPAGLGPGRYTLARWNLLISDDMVARAPDGSHFVGSAITMPRAIQNLMAGCGLTADQVDAVTRRNPRAALSI